MVGLSYASVPLYRLFCQATGYQGATRTALRAPDAASAATITVRLDANVNNTLPWSFAPEQPRGDDGAGRERDRGLSGEEPVGQADGRLRHLQCHARSNSGQYFNKIQCFCFTEHALKPGESAELPVTFFVDPKIRDNPDTADIRDDHALLHLLPGGRRG